MTPLSLSLTGDPDSAFSSVLDLFESKTLIFNEPKKIPGGATITLLPTAEQRSLTQDAAPVMEMVIAVGGTVGTVAVNMISNYLYDKLKARKDNVKLRINRRIIELDEGKISRIIEEEIKLTTMNSRGRESLARSMWEVIKWPILLLVIFAVIHQFFYNADKEDVKKKAAERAALAVPLSSDEASADATIVHWVRSADHDDSGEYSIYFTKGEVYCGGVSYALGPDYAPELASFQVKDPVEKDAEEEKNGGPPDMFTTKGWHDFKDIHSARAYLRDRCLLLNMAKRIRADQ